MSNAKIDLDLKILARYKYLSVCVLGDAGGVVCSAFGTRYSTAVIALYVVSLR